MKTNVQETLDELGGAFTEFKRTHREALAEAKAENDQLRARIETIEAGSLAGGSIGSAAIEKDRKALARFMRTGDRSGLEPGAAKSISTSTPASNAMVPSSIANEIDRFASGSSAMLGVVRVTQVANGNYSRIVRVGASAIGRVGETGSRSTTNDATFRQRTPTHGEMYALPRVTRHVLEDAQFNLSQFLVEDVGLEFAKAVDLDTISGNGTNRATGILNGTPVTTADDASPLRSAEVIQYVAAPSPDNLGDHLIDAYFSLAPQYRRNASWVMNSATLGAVRKLKASTGGTYQFWQSTLGEPVDAGDGFLLGKPVVINENMPDFGQSPLDYPILVGDFRQGYELVRIGGITLIRDDVTVPGFVNFYIAQRLGGILTNNDAIKALQR